MVAFTSSRRQCFQRCSLHVDYSTETLCFSWLSADVLCVTSAQLTVLFSRRAVQLCMYLKCCDCAIRWWLGRLALTSALPGWSACKTGHYTKPALCVYDCHHSRRTTASQLLSRSLLTHSRHGHFSKCYSLQRCTVCWRNILRLCVVSCMFTRRYV